MDSSLKTVCLYLPSHVTETSAKKRSSYSARKEAGPNGAPTVVRYADGRLAFRKSAGNGLQSSTGLRSCMYPEIKTGAPCRPASRQCPQQRARLVRYIRVPTELGVRGDAPLESELKKGDCQGCDH